MRLGGPVFSYSDPDSWIAALKHHGYTAAYCPVDSKQADSVVKAYASAARKADIIIAEVGAWSNPISPNEETRRSAIRYCQEQLELADRIGARCCVNISGSRGSQWDGPHPDNLTRDTFDLIVETVREIIDAVKPKRTWYTLETMPWTYPDSADSYLKLIKAIDRKEFAVHFDPVNLVSSPQLFYDTGALISDFLERLGPYIRSCHAKDIALSERLTVHLDEVRPGMGGLDYRTLFRGLDKLDPDMPLMLEHLKTQEEYSLAAGYIRSVAREEGVVIR